MSRKVLNVEDVKQPDILAKVIAERYDTWKRGRDQKEAEWVELRNYIFATDTTTTTNASLPWKNKTTRPKLCQIRDNLHANYMAALFPNDSWFNWIPFERDAAAVAKRDAVVAYMKNKIRDSQFKQAVATLLYDYIDYGNSIADVEYVNERWLDAAGNEIVGYVGPKIYRISPLDIVFDITGTSFLDVPKITRSLVSFGEFAKRVRTGDPSTIAASEKVLAEMIEFRKQVLAYRPEDIRKSEALVADGFDSLYTYYSSGLVELLEFEGDLYDAENGKLMENVIITVADRMHIIRNEPIKSWSGRSTKNHVGWRLRPDNLLAMGPLDNLVGMQYRIDHLENLKADVFDMIAHPVIKIRGNVEEFVFQPGERVFMDADADVDTLRPDTTALNADVQIDRLLIDMEEMAGAPREAMGIRSPGEKTAFEIQSLQNASSRMFQQKLAFFEENLLEPLLNGMLEVARINLDVADLIGVVDPDIGTISFLSVTKQDLKAKGRLVPMGARHFAAQAQLVQNLTALAQGGIWQDQGVRVHLSGKEMARLTVENLNLSSHGLYRENVQVEESAATQQLSTAAQQKLEQGAITPTIDDEQYVREIAGRSLPEAGPQGEEVDGNIFGTA
jgi:hypothetical protein